MLMSVSVYLLSLLACTSPEQEAGRLALRYSSLGVEEVEMRHSLACADEQAAKGIDDLQAELDDIKSTLGKSWDESVIERKKETRTVKSTTLSQTRDAGEVVVLVAVPQKDGTTKEEHETFSVRLENEAWCVVPGWVEQKQLDDVRAEVDALKDKATTLGDTWALDEAEAALKEAEARVATLPDDESWKKILTDSINLTRMVLDVKKTGWVGGRWRVTEETDPMTDQKNVVVTLQSVEGLPNIMGETKPAMFIVRCKRNKLEVFIATSSMLDSNWRYDSVSGQHRFGTAPAERFSGDVSASRESVFLRNPRGWMDQLRSHEAEDWIVELPLYNRSPASVRFDLDSAGKALDAVPATCK